MRPLRNACAVPQPSVIRRIDEICSFERRLPGSDAERRAANHLRAALERRGRRAELEPTWVQPQWALVGLIHLLIAAIGSIIAGFAPAVSFALCLLAATSFYLDLGGRLYLLRRLPFRRASQNVVSASPALEAAERVILCANYDAPRTGAAYNAAPMRLLKRAAERFPVTSSPPRIIFWSMALLLPVLGARMAGLDAAWVPLLQLPQTLVLIVGAFAYGEIALSPPSPGANDNAAGVAALLGVVEQLDDDPPANLGVDAALIGGGETTMQGMRSYVRGRRKELDRNRTWFIALDEVGRGEVRWLSSEGSAVSMPMSPELIDLCEALALAGEEGDAGYGAAAMRHGYATAAAVARANRYEAIALTCREPGRALPLDHHSPRDLPERIDPAAVERSIQFAVALVRLLDREVGRRAGARPPAATGAGAPAAS